MAILSVTILGNAALKNKFFKKDPADPIDQVVRVKVVEAAANAGTMYRATVTSDLHNWNFDTDKKYTAAAFGTIRFLVLPAVPTTRIGPIPFPSPISVIDYLHVTVTNDSTTDPPTPDAEVIEVVDEGLYNVARGQAYAPPIDLPQLLPPQQGAKGAKS